MKNNKIDNRKLFETVLKNDILFDHHETDLYIVVNEQTKKLIDKYEFKNRVTTFESRYYKNKWFNIPFAFDRMLFHRLSK